MVEPVEANDEITIRTDLRPGDVGSITYLHGVLYAREHGWDHTFEAYVAGPLSEFALRNNARERIWIVERGARVVGSIAIVEVSAEQAQLRWFQLRPELRGRGLGKQLMRDAMQFCRDRGYRSVLLWTVAGLEASRHLYLSTGFTLTSEDEHRQWGAVVTEQRYDLEL